MRLLLVRSGVTTNTEVVSLRGGRGGGGEGGGGEMGNDRGREGE